MKAFASLFNKKVKLSSLIIVCLVVALLAGVGVYMLVMGQFGSRDAFLDAQKYVEIEKLIEDNFIGDTSSEEMFDSAASAMVRSLNDKWSYYMDAEEYEAYKLSSANEYAGIGVSVKLNDEGRVEVVSVTSGTPAASAGISAGQYIVSIDGQKTEGMSLTDVQTLIRSLLNKDFSMVIADQKGNESTVTLNCEIIHKSSVSHKLLDNKVGYVKIEDFEAGSGEEAIKSIEYLISIGASSIIFDLRDNPGGLLSQLVEVLDYILPEGEIFVSVDKEGNETVTSSDKTCLKYKMAVLVNADTYSAAEFFAAALQEYNWATIVGERTTGKSRSQITIETSDGGAVHLSTRQYLTPNRVDLVEAGGVAPDLEIANTDSSKDAQLEGAIKALS